jgi:membrane fusion protein (multidrug efflux system)
MQLHRSSLTALPMALWLLAACSPGEPPAPPPVEVVVAPVIQRDVEVRSEWIGTTQGSVDAEIRAQVSGTLLSRDYQEGRLVKTGDLLFRIDARAYQAALDQARGELGRAQAALAKAKVDVARYTPLAAEGAVSQRELDNALAMRDSGEASVQSGRAAVEKARLDLSFTEVRAPVDGIAGIASVQVGNLVGPSDPKPLTSVSNVDPILVVVPLSEREYLAYARRPARTEGAEPNLELLLTDGSVHPQRGRAIVAGRAVDPKTGTILFKGEFPNPGNLLRPGQYARVRAVTETKRGALLVPQRAVQELQGVQQVAVVGADDKVTLRVVETGVRDGSLQVIEKGLELGERVIVEGLQKVRAGSLVKATAVDAAIDAAPPAAGS